MPVNPKSLENLKHYEVGNPGGPGRTPERVPAFLRRLVNAETPEEVERLVISGMRNPLIAAKLRALRDDDPDLANRATEQVWDRVFGKPRQTVEHGGEVNLRVSLLDALRDTGDDAA